jgi:hypothetical protein
MAAPLICFLTNGLPRTTGDTQTARWARFAMIFEHQKEKACACRRHQAAIQMMEAETSVRRLFRVALRRAVRLAITKTLRRFQSNA